MLSLIAQGRSNQAIARVLSLNIKTVEHYIATLFVHLGLEDSTEGQPEGAGHVALAALRRRDVRATGRGLTRSKVEGQPGVVGRHRFGRLDAGPDDVDQHSHQRRRGPPIPTQEER